MSKVFYCYENGRKERITMRKVYRQFTTIVDEEQKEQGTTFTSWLSEMISNQIFVEG